MNLDEGQKCGYLVDINYETATLLTEDNLLERIGGLEQGAFLIAESKDEEYILLRVIQPTELVDAGQRNQLKNDSFGNQLVNDVEDDLDLPAVDNMDALSKREMQKQGYGCQVLGTFYKTENGELEFGADVQTLFSGAKYQVYKPNDKLLEKIVNYNINSSPATVGELSYSETKIRDTGDDYSVPAQIDLTDFTGAKTALFGMTRTGKSNTIKVIASALHKSQLEGEVDGVDSFGQLIIDASGEYANPNPQDGDIAISMLPESVVYTNRELDTMPENYKVMVDNLYRLKNLEKYKRLISTLLEEDYGYIQDFEAALDTVEPPDYIEERFDGKEYFRERYHNKNKLSILYTILTKLDQQVGENIDFESSYDSSADEVGVIINSAPKPDFDDVQTEFPFFGSDRNLSIVSTDWESKLDDEKSFIQFSSPDEQRQYWEDIRTYLEENEILEDSGLAFSNATLNMLEFTEGEYRGVNNLSSLVKYHESRSKESTINQVYSHLEDGRLVILDMSAGNEELIKTEAETSIKRIYEQSKKQFRENDDPPAIQIYLEEAHRHFDSDSMETEDNIYVRMAKEGAKMDIGLAYATQEVSSIDERVLSNTANWFVTHLNNDKELQNLISFYDFASFQRSIRRVDQQGFSKLLTKSHRYTVPIRVSKFTRDYIINELEYTENNLTEFNLNGDT